MTFGRKVVYAVLTAVLAGVVTYVTQAMSGAPLASCKGNALTFISFATWACYFVAGSNIKGAINWFLSMAVGAVAAILMFALTVAFMPAMGYLPAVSVAVIIIVIFMMFTDDIKCNTSAVFVGTALFFAIAAAGGLPEYTISAYLMAAITELLYTAIGLFAGYLTIVFFVACSKKES